MPKIKIDGRPMGLGMLRAVIEVQGSNDPIQIELAAGCRQAVNRSAKLLEEILASDQTVYGINTGFGLLASQRISTKDLNQLQTNLVLSHAAGTGRPLDDRIVRLIMVLKMFSLAQGFSGVRLELIEALSKLLAADVLPVIPGKGSVGASGDLAPLAHMAAGLLGVGNVRMDGQTIPASTALKQIGMEPIQLGPKEGLALLNGTQVSTALALDGLFQAQRLFRAAVMAGAMSVDAAMGSDAPFDERIHRIRPHQGQGEVARTYKSLLVGSEIRESHVDCDRVQDPYSLRCQPQVMGACLDHIRFVAKTLQCEANSVTDNPLVFTDSGEVLSGGNFHAEPVLSLIHI